MAPVPSGGAGKFYCTCSSKFQAGASGAKLSGSAGEEWVLCRTCGEAVGEGVDMFCEREGTGEICECTGIKEDIVYKHSK